MAGERVEEFPVRLSGNSKERALHSPPFPSTISAPVDKPHSIFVSSGFADTEPTISQFNSVNSLVSWPITVNRANARQIFNAS